MKYKRFMNMRLTKDEAEALIEAGDRGACELEQSENEKDEETALKAQTVLDTLKTLMAATWPAKKAKDSGTCYAISSETHKAGEFDMGPFLTEQEALDCVPDDHLRKPAIYLLADGIEVVLHRWDSDEMEWNPNLGAGRR